MKIDSCSLNRNACKCVLTIVLLILLNGIQGVSQHMDTPLINKEKPSDQVLPLQFRNIGPSRGGRVTAVSGVNKEPNVFYMGATGGGLWKTTDYGFNWKNISDSYFASPSIGAIVVDQNAPNNIFVGTGSDAIRSNVIVGKGIYKSSDSGETWSFSGLEDAGQIGSLIMHPQDGDVVYAAVIGHPFKKSKERGIYQTKDGGENWEQIFMLSDSVGALDLEFAPDNPQIIYASMWRAERKPWTIISGSEHDGIYKSIDGGISWKKKTIGLPKGLMGKIDFAVSPDMPKRVWALVQADNGDEGLYRSDDYGERWTKVEIPQKVQKSIMYRPFYFTNLSANPQNANQLYTGTKILWTTKDGGSTWSRLPTTHVDHHDLWINPADPNLMVEGNDGGAAISRDGGNNWSTVFNQPTAELYSCYVDDQFPYYVYSGQQDNSSIRVPSSQPFQNVLASNESHGMNEMTYWEAAGGCETGPVIPKPNDPDIIYANCKGRFSIYNKRTGIEQAYYIGAESVYGNHPDDITYRYQRVTPMEVSPHDPEVIYYGSQYLHRTDNGGLNWEQISPDLTANEKAFRMRSGTPIDEDISGEEYYATLYAIEESTLEKGVIWTGSNDGLFHLTKDGGNHWENVTPEMPSGGRVANIEASLHDAGSAFYSVYRDYLGDEKPYIYKTDNYGKSWKLLTNGKNGIPDNYVTRVVRQDPHNSNLLFAGTEFGLFISFDGGNKWKSFQQNLPIVPITDIRIHRNDLVLSTLGRSFWVLDDISVLRQWTDRGSTFKVFTPELHYNENRSIYFQLEEPVVDSTISLEIFRDSEKYFSQQVHLKNHPADELGIRRFQWNGRFHFDENAEIDGPLAPPGKYEIRMIRNGVEKRAELIKALRPDMEQSGISKSDLIEQEKLAKSVGKLLLEIRKEISNLEKQIESNHSVGSVNKAKTNLNKLMKGPKRYDKPMLWDHTEYLYEMIISAPQLPGKDAYERYEFLLDAWEDYNR